MYSLFHPIPESVISHCCYLGLNKVKILWVESVSPETGQRAKNLQTQLSHLLGTPGNSKLSSPTFFLFNPSNGLVSQGLTTYQQLPAHLPLAQLSHCTSSSLFSSHFLSGLKSTFFLLFLFVCLPLLVCFFIPDFTVVSFLWSTAVQNTFRPTSSAFLMEKGEGAGGSSHIHSYAAMITPLTLQNPTHGGRIEFRTTTIY